VLRLPVEVLDEIFSYAKPSTLTRLALVCHTFEGVATRLLYRHIPSLSLSLVTSCLETLVSKPSLAAHTRTWEIGDTSFLDSSRKGLLSPTFFRLLQSALHNMHRLTELTFLLNGPTSHVLLGAPFKLTKLTASCDFDKTFASWLTEQTALRAAIFCGNFTTGVTLPSEALPSLRRVAAAPLTLACVLPGRPIREVDLCLVHPWSLNREVLQTTIRLIAFSKGPLDSLKIISHLAEPPETVLSALEAIPSSLNSISKLALHAVSGSITEVRTHLHRCILSRVP
jgi:F-box-like